MRTDKLNYELPPELIAQQPSKLRSDSKLLVFNRSSREIIDTNFSKIGNFLHPNDCLVLNDTRVLPARFFARRQTSGRLEGLFLSEKAPGLWEVMLKGARKVKSGEDIILQGNQQNSFYTATLTEKQPGGTCLLHLHSELDAETILEQIGFAPLPPYIKRDEDLGQAEMDKDRYQTVYAQKTGAVAAPTAGLHFTKELIEQLKNQNVNFAYVTLHVGAGTFKPVTAENLDDHQIHQEWFSIDDRTIQMINSAKQKEGRIIAVGTTSVRTLETAAKDLEIESGQGVTKLFIQPGYEFKTVDAMVTNFHLPKSTLLALVAAFAGLENTLTAYHHAIEQRYRFYSYGDAMLII
ncbi:MAG: tRNA preQ1(34) S-adenosylmethionine ribosyltransferase-isomerase QueA [Planctomycetes bacterium]|nr:tRNA preQ1(34) S-adenosylmethionine ribosyltransferase-isomerase QueA [Planctomycetota bacterium]